MVNFTDLVILMLVKLKLWLHNGNVRHLFNPSRACHSYARLVFEQTQ